jgi:hypothetical protein
MVRIPISELEELIRKNRNEFDDASPANNHAEIFLSKLAARIRHLVSIVPYLIKVFVITVIIFVSSIIVWNNYIRKDRHEITLKEKVFNIVRLKKQ